MANKSIPQLNPDTSPKRTYLFYTAKRKNQGGYVDRKSELSTLKIFSNTSRTMPKGGNYTVSATECDDRWFSNRNAVAAITFSLPPVQPGLVVGFTIEKSYSVTITPNVNDKIMPDGGADGVSIIATVVGSSITLRGYDDGWHVLSEVGSWIAV